MQLSPEQVDHFREVVWRHYDEHARSMPWRDDPTAYKVLVSELMLQQTQVPRVIPKFESFMYTFPNFEALAIAPLSDVLTMWSGLGYNRRAKFLHQTAQIVVDRHGGTLPESLKELVALPGIGLNTAGAIMAYAFDQPVAYVETNIRTVLFHHFFPDGLSVSDHELRSVMDQVLDRERPRQWYWAMMDYGFHLKKTAGGRIDQSAHYVKQKPLKGSIREVRGQIVRSLTTGPRTLEELKTVVGADERFDAALQGLQADGLVKCSTDIVSLS